MAIVQEAFDISEDIMTKISTGEYRRIGGVVRYAVGSNKGQIVKHLDPVNVKAAEQAQGIGAKALKFVKNNKKGFIIVGAVVGAATIGGTVYHKVKNREPEVVKQFRLALKEYINAIRTGNLDMDVIERLMVSLEEMKKNKDYEKISIQLSTEELDVLVNRIYEYTMKFAKDNEVELTDEEQGESDNAIINLQKYLKTQKRIFESAA